MAEALADRCLDILAGAREVEAGFAGLKARAAAKYADTVHAIAPAAPVQAQDMAIAAEIGCLLAVSSRTADSFLAASHALAKSLPLTLSALKSGIISWQHALVMVDQAATLDSAGAASLERHFLDPDAPKPATAAPVGELPAYRLKAKARTWRERHRTESIEKRSPSCARTSAATGSSAACLQPSAGSRRMPERNPVHRRQPGLRSW